MIGAIIGAAATIGASLLSSKATKKGATQAANAEAAVAEKNNALAREFRASNTANFSPNLASGFAGNALVDSFLYGPQAAPAATVQPAPAYSPGGYAAPATAGGYEMTGSEFLPDYSIGMTAMNARGAANLARGRAQATVPGQVTATPPVAPPNALTGAPMNGYETFQASPYFQFPLQEGLRALDHRLAASGMNESGAGIKAAVRYGQDYGAGRMGEFISLAERQANRGLTGASAIAGVSQNALGAMTANNQGAADAAANAALLRAQANSQLYGGIGNALGYLASSYGGK